MCVGDSGTGITAGELGLAYTNEEVIRQALEIGQKGNVLQRFRTQRTIKENGPLVLELAYEVDQEKVRGNCGGFLHRIEPCRCGYDAEKK